MDFRRKSSGNGMQEEEAGGSGAGRNIYLHTFSRPLIVSFGGNLKVRSFLTKVRLRNVMPPLTNAISHVNRTPPWR
jgi:hypothetical protein